MRSGGERVEQDGHRGSLSCEQAHEAFWFGQSQGTLELRQGTWGVAVGLVGEGLEDEDLDGRARPSAGLRGGQQPRQQGEGREQVVAGTGGGMPGQQDPGQGHVLVLAQVGQVVVGGDASVRRPAEGFVLIPVGSEKAGAHGGHRPHVGREVAGVHAVRLVEQGERGGRVPLAFLQPGHGDAPAVGVLRQPGAFAELLAGHEERGRGVQVVALEGDLTQAHVHVGRTAQHRSRRAVAG